MTTPSLRAAAAAARAASAALRGAAAAARAAGGLVASATLVAAAGAADAAVALLGPTEPEVEARLAYIAPDLSEKVAAAAEGRRERGSGKQRASRNVAAHVGLGQGTAELRRLQAAPQAAQRGGRRLQPGPGSKGPSTVTCESRCGF